MEIKRALKMIINNKNRHRPLEAIPWLGQMTGPSLSMNLPFLIEANPILSRALGQIGGPVGLTDEADQV